VPKRAAVPSPRRADLSSRKQLIEDGALISHEASKVYDVIFCLVVCGVRMMPGFLPVVTPGEEAGRVFGSQMARALAPLCQGMSPRFPPIWQSRHFGVAPGFNYVLDRENWGAPVPLRTLERFDTPPGY
jgi:hypothetical protein